MEIVLSWYQSFYHGSICPWVYYFWAISKSNKKIKWTEENLLPWKYANKDEQAIIVKTEYGESG